MRTFGIGFVTAWLLGLSLTTAYSQHGNEATKAAVAAVQPAEGLKVELFASDPLLFNPVAFAIDEDGRFFIAESHRWKDSVFDLWTKDDRWKMADFSFTQVEQREKFLRQEFATNLALLTKDSEVIRLVEDRDGDGVAESSRVFADGFNEVTSGTAAGVLALDGSLWFTCIPDLWKFDYDETGRALNRQKLHTGYGVRISVSGHDLHGLVQGPDGRIYFSVGDRGANVLSPEGKRLETVNSGAVFRCEPDGSHLELFATGLRNPQDLAFDDFGNLWTHDNDTGGEDPPRVLQIVEGGDYGWRQSYQFMPEFGPWVREKIWEGKLDDVLPSAGFGAQGPAGMAAYPGVGLPEKYRGALIACDFPQGVWAYHFDPDGATYRLRKERFLWALGPTDVDFGPEGNVYISDWGRSYRMPNGGRLLRVSGPSPAPLGQEVKALLQGGIEKAETGGLMELLGHPDRRVRMEAQFALEKRGEEAVLAQVAKGKANQLARIHAIWGLGNLARKGAKRDAGVLAGLADDPDPEIRAQAARQLGEAPSTDLTISALTALLEDESLRVQMRAALSLGRVKATGEAATAGLLKLAAQHGAGHPFIRHAVLFALANSSNLEAIHTAAASENPAVRRMAVLACRRLRSPELASFLEDSNPIVRRDAARAINDVPVAEAFPALAARLNSDETDPQILLRAINANFRLGGEREWERVLSFASSEGTEDLRVAALSALTDWGSPTPLDRVVGLWRPLHMERAAGDPNRLTATLRALLKTAPALVVQATLESVEKLGIKELGPDLAVQVANTRQPVAIRVRALKVLGSLKDDSLNTAVATALADKDEALQAEAVSWLPSVDPERALLLIREILAGEGNLRIRQNALAAAAKLKDSKTDRFLQEQLEQVMSGRLDSALALDIFEAIETREDPKLKAKVEGYLNGLKSRGSLAAFGWARAGGDAAAGKRIFHERDAVGCLRCHALSGQGGTVGPDLAGVATRRDREFLLESIVHPNAQITTGYESVAVKLKDGRTFAGSVQSDDGVQMVINSAEDGVMTIPQSEIETKQRTLSPMPEGLVDLLTRRELRDLVEYLASLK